MGKSKRNKSSQVGSIVAGLSIVIFGIGLAWIFNTGVSKVPIKQYFSDKHTNAVWDWSNINNHSSTNLKQTADFMYMHQINTVYVDIGVYNDIQNVKDSAEKDKKMTQFNNSVTQYISAMNKRKIKVFAAAGDTDWSKVDKQYIPLSIQKYVHDYNKANPNTKFSGIEFDIESYNQDQFPEASFTEKELVLNEFLDLVDRLATAQTQYIDGGPDKSLELGFAIPYWYDNQNQNIKSVTWHDKTGPVLYHVLDRLNTLPTSNVVVMAYRNAASGNDGMIYHSRTEVEYASARDPRVKVLIGVEVNDVEPAKITFYNRTYTQLTSEVNKVYTEFEKQTSFRGTAINDLAGYQKMKDSSK